MRFQIKTLFLILLAAGFLLHVGACLRGYPLVKLFHVLHVFAAGLGVTLFLTVLCSSFLPRIGQFIGLIMGILSWAVMLWFLVVFEGEVFQFVWIHAMTMVATSILVVVHFSDGEHDTQVDAHSIDRLKEMRKGNSN